MKRGAFFLSVVSFCGALALFLWLASFLNFVHVVRGYARFDDAFSDTQAIVVLTGGSDRTSAGIELLRQNKGKKLLISGVFPGVDVKSFSASRALSQEMAACCVVLGRTARDTRGNAREARAFMEAEGFSSLRLVTAHYHMPRSLLLFRAEMPDVTIVPYPVFPAGVDWSSWWLNPRALSLLVFEHSKYSFERFLRKQGPS